MSLKVAHSGERGGSAFGAMPPSNPGVVSRRPEPDISPLLDHLIGLQVEKRFWDRQSEGLRGPEVDDY
jgi:hypothetical protein